MTAGHTEATSTLRRIVVLTASPDAGIRLARDFDDIHIAGPDEADAELAAYGSSTDCVGVTDVPADAESLRRLFALLLERCAPHVLFLLDTGDEVGRTLLYDASPLAGLTTVAVAEIGGRPCLVLVRTTAAGDVDPAAVFQAIGATPVVVSGLPADATTSFVLAQAHVLDAQAGSYRDALEQARLDLDTTRQSLVDATADNAFLKSQVSGGPVSSVGPRAVKLPPKQRVRASLQSRLRTRRSATLAGLAAGATIVVAAIATAIALATGSGVTGGLTSALLLLTLPALAYIVRAQRRIARSVSSIKKIQRNVDSLARRVTESKAALDELRQRTRVIEGNVSVIAATVVDRTTDPS